MKFGIIPPLVKAYLASDITHGALKIMFLKNGPVFRAEKVNGRQSHFFYFDAQLFERKGVVSPLANRMIDIAFYFFFQLWNWYKCILKQKRNHNKCHAKLFQ